MTQPPPDRAPEEQVSAAFVLPLRAFQPDVDSGFWYVHDANGMEVATCYCDSSGARARAIVAAVNGAAALRARGAADEAARNVVVAARRDHAHRGNETCNLCRAVACYDAALARERDETNKAGEEGGRPSDHGHAAGLQPADAIDRQPSSECALAGASTDARVGAPSSPAAYPYKPQDGGSGSIDCAPATPPAEATADRILRDWRKGASGEALWTHSDGNLLVQLIAAAIESHAAAAEQRAREECEAASLARARAAQANGVLMGEERMRSELEQAVAAKERALAEREQIRRCLFQMQEAAKDLAQPARQPAAPPVETVFLARELNDWRDAGAPPSVVALAILKLIRAEIARAAAGDAG